MAVDVYNQCVDGQTAATLTMACGGSNTSGPKVLVQAHHSQTFIAKAFDTYNHAMRESGQGYWMEDDKAGTLRAEGENRPSRPSHVISQANMAVRRLTPTECERLQGFKDGHTNIPWRGKPESPDGLRYKALGNSMAVPVMNWIGKRISLSQQA
jgi:site-specific DNA-cytosine methylase